MRFSFLLSLLSLLAAGLATADRVPFAKHRFSLEFPKDWKKGEGPDDGHVLLRESPDGNGVFSVYLLEVKKDHRADLKGTLESRVKAIAKAGLKVTGDVEGQEGAVDSKEAVFAVIPVEAEVAGQSVEFRYYLVLVDAKDSVVIMQVALPSPAGAEIQQTALDIIQSFREGAEDDPGETDEQPDEEADK